MESKIEKAYNLAIDFEAREQVIGIQKEKILHRTLKYFLCEDESFHEVKIPKLTSGFLYADIKINNHIYEIQTRNFNALRDKLDEFLKKYQVTIVHPIAYEKNVFKIDEDNKIVSKKKSPKKGNPLELFYELYKIKSYLQNELLSFKIIMINIDEYRKIVAKKHYRSSGYIRQVQIPKEIIRIIDLKNKGDYLSLLDGYPLPIQFTSKEFAKCTHITQKKATVALNILTYLNVLTRVGKIQKSYLYEKNTIQ